MELSIEKKNGQRNCVSCNEILDADHTGIRCLQSHDICTDCTKPFLLTMFTDPEASIPPKCRVCNIKYVPLSIERQLNSAQLQIFLFYMAIKQVTRKDRIVHCPFCRYFEIWLKECTSNFFYCKDPICMKGSCSVCHKEFKIPKNDKNISIEEAKEMKSKTGMESHFLCYEYKEIKKDWEDAILNGNRTVCPKCKIGGIKDDACTHMTCNNCGTVYCYICGDSEDKVNKSNKSGNIFKHNINWKHNKKRCPMYFLAIKDIDNRYDFETDRECLELFHKLKTLRNIKEFIFKHGMKKYRKLCQIFSSVANHGYDIMEAMTSDLTLIWRDI